LTSFNYIGTCTFAAKVRTCKILIKASTQQIKTKIHVQNTSVNSLNFIHIKLAMKSVQNNKLW